MKKQLIIIIIGAFFLSGCAYGPLMTDIPLISEKGEMRLNAGICPHIGAYTSLSYGLTDQIAVQGHAVYETSFFNGYSSIQGAVGTFRNLRNNRVIEAYTGLGYGAGWEYSDVEDDCYDISTNYGILFGQFNYGRNGTGKYHFERGVSARLASLYATITDECDKPYRHYKKGYLTFEPTAFFRLGGEKLKVGMQLGSVVPLWVSKKTYPEIMNYGVNIGLSVNYKLINSRK